MENLLDSMFTEVDGLPYPNLAIRNDSTIRAIIERDGGRPDANGKLKRLRATKELAYVYFMCKRDLHTGFTRDQKADKCKLKAGLPEAWEEDALIKSCIAQVSEDSVTKQDKLLDTVEELAEDYLEVFSEMKVNNRRRIEFLRQNIAGLTPEEIALRTTEIESAMKALTQFTAMFKDVRYVTTQLDELRVERMAAERKRSKAALSSTETKKERYERKADAEV